MQPKTCKEFVLNWSRSHFLFGGGEQGPVWEATREDDKSSEAVWSQTRG